ncbi:sulfotransferase [Albimonas pacifica]|uniref:Sulfotransferase family protein n=1 Tax=Albimonas pacifica TaxID=1114924 RepID=A0A1I3DC05_9RHOB|nr:sulfotransferase [Albimonas pacifica]SFH84255.1 Sulfotransferase family protein [Albimonas pacifica]
MILAALLLSVLVFVAALRLTRVEPAARRTLATAREASAAMRDPTLDDDAKEALARRAAGRMLGAFAHLALAGAAALAAAGAVVWAGAQAGLYTLAGAEAVATGWPFLAGSTVFAILAWIAVSRLPRRDAAADDAADADPEVPYGAADRALHRIGFATLGVQRRMAQTEAERHAAAIDLAHARRPIFIASLPRAGTTVTLQALASLPELASATYRHMPFPLFPLTWGETSRRFRREASEAERAHGDGLSVGFDSPEAFEEPAWMAWWPEHYRGGVVRAWAPDERREGFERFMRSHMARVVAAERRHGTRPEARRYVAKNNAGIARIGLLHATFPDASVVVPVRHPWAQVASLMRQHARFERLHRKDPFGRRYMEGLGHFEFGQALRPLAFGTARPDRARAHEPAFWLEIWCAAFETLLAQAGPRTILVDHEALSADPAPHLAALAEALALDDPAALVAQAGRLRPGRTVPAPDAPAELLARAEALHRALVARALRPHPTPQPEPAFAGEAPTSIRSAS